MVDPGAARSQASAPAPPSRGPSNIKNYMTFDQSGLSEARYGSIRMESRMARISDTSWRGEAGDQFAAITRRTPSTSRIQSSSVRPASLLLAIKLPTEGCGPAHECLALALMDASAVSWLARRSGTVVTGFGGQGGLMTIGFAPLDRPCSEPTASTIRRHSRPTSTRPGAAR